MAIYTRFGSEVKITGANNNGTVNLEYADNGESIDYDVPVAELKADGGLKEIYREIRIAKAE